MIRLMFHCLQFGPGIRAFGFVMLGLVASIQAQETKTEAPTLPKNTSSPVERGTAAASLEGGGASGGKDEDQTIDREEIEAGLKSAKETVDPGDAASQDLVDRYQELLYLCDTVEAQRALLESYTGALTSAPEVAKEIRTTLEATPQVESGADHEDRPPAGLSREASVKEINNRLAAARMAELDAKNKLKELEAELRLQQNRPDAIRDRTITVQQGLTEAETEAARLKSKADATEADQLSLMKARLQVEAFKAELAALEQEQLSYDVRVVLAEERRDLAKRLAANAEAETAAIQRFADKRLDDSVNDAAVLAKQARTDTEGRPEVVRGVAVEIAELAKEFGEIDRKISKVSSAANDAETRLGDLQQQHDELKTAIGIGGMREAQGELLLDQRRLMPDLRSIHSDLSRSRAAISETRLKLYQIQRDLRESPETVAANLLEETSLTGGARERLNPELVALVEKRNELLQELSGQYRRLLAEEGDYDLALRQLAELTTESEAFLNEKLLWVRSSDPVSLSTFTALPSGLVWLFRADRSKELRVALDGLWDHSAPLIILEGVVFLFLILTRSRCKRRITELGSKVRKISTDRYLFTFQAFLFTLVLAVPYSIIPAFLGWRLLQTPDASDWLQGLAKGLVFSGYLLSVVLFTRALCRKGGLAEQHFRWRSHALVSLRENVTWISIVYIPAAIVITITLDERGATHLASIGRVTFIVMMLWVAFFLRRLLDRQTGVMSLIIRDHPENFVARTLKFWTFLFIIFPLAFIILALAGYTLTGLSLMKQFRLTIEIIGVGVVTYAMIIRWFSMRERKLVLEQRIRERQERAETEAREAEGGGTDSIDEGGLPEFDEDSIDFEEVGDQTRRLLRFVIGAAVAIAIWFGWADILPALRGLDSINIVGDLSLGALIPAVFILIVTTIAAKNLPGLLEIGVLSHTPLDPGLRYTIISLCQYAFVAVGLFLTIGALGIDWSSFGWIVAALSVGLGFGLQEIVANFVCGMILLFERPIRVGDVVTVSGTTGVVSKIQIRATTIINYDRQEFIVPNKEFITGNLLNWTLSTTLNRIVIMVGVAYGSDTRRARDLLVEICNSHPDVLAEPASSAVFDGFGDSTLNFTVRIYLSSMEHRLDVTNELHHQIHERFAAEGIEIAFPRMDLHLRSIAPGIQLGDRQSSEPGTT